MLTHALTTLGIKDVSHLDSLYSELCSISSSGKEPSKELKEAVATKEFTHDDILARLRNSTPRYNIADAIWSGHFNIFQFLIDNELGGKDYNDIMETAILAGKLCMVDHLIKRKREKLPPLDEVLLQAAGANQRHIVHYLITNQLIAFTPKTALLCLNSYIQLTEELPHEFIKQSDELKQCNITGYIVTISDSGYANFEIPSDDNSSLINAANANLIIGCSYVDTNGATKKHLGVRDRSRIVVPLESFSLLKKASYIGDTTLYSTRDLPIIKFLCEHKESGYSFQELEVKSLPKDIVYLYQNCYFGEQGGSLSQGFIKIKDEAKLGTNYQDIIKNLDKEFIYSWCKLGKKTVQDVLSKKETSQLSNIYHSYDLQYYAQEAMYEHDKKGDANHEQFTLSQFIEADPISGYAIIYALDKLKNDPSTQSGQATEKEIQLKFAAHISHYNMTTKNITHDMTHWVYSRILSVDFCPEDTISLIENSFLQPLLLTLLNEGDLAIPPVLVNIIFEYTGNLRLLRLFCCLYGEEEGIQQLQALYEKNKELTKHTTSKNTLSTSRSSTVVIAPAALDEKKHEVSTDLPELELEQNTTNEYTLTVYFSGTPHNIHEPLPVFPDIDNSLKSRVVKYLYGRSPQPISFHTPLANFLFAHTQKTATHEAMGFSGCGVTNGIRGTLFGYGLEEQCNQVKQRVLTLIEQSKKVKLNCYGHDRGGIAAFLLVKMLGVFSKESLEINLALFDVVPGNYFITRKLDILGITLTSQTMDLSQSRNLANVLSIYTSEATSDLSVHAPLIPIYPKYTNVVEDVFPGAHAEAQFVDVTSSQHILQFFGRTPYSTSYNRNLYDKTFLASFFTFNAITEFLYKYGTRFDFGNWKISLYTPEHSLISVPVNKLVREGLEDKKSAKKVKEQVITLYDLITPYDLIIPFPSTSRGCHSKRSAEIIVDSRESKPFCNLHHMRLFSEIIVSNRESKQFCNLRYKTHFSELKETEIETKVASNSSEDCALRIVPSLSEASTNNSPEIVLAEQTSKFKKFLYLLSTSLSEKSNSTQKGNCLRKYMNEAKDIEFSDEASLENALRNVIALALQRDRNSWSFFSTTTSGYAILDLLRCREYSAFAALVYNGPPAKMTYANLRTFVLGLDDKSYFYTRNKSAMYEIHQKEDNTLTSKNMTAYLRLGR